MLLHSDKDMIVDDFDSEESNNCMPVTLAREQRNFENHDISFWTTFNKIYSNLTTALTTRKEEEYYRFLKSSHGQGVEIMRDHLHRTFLHIAVEQQNIVYTKLLVEIGCSVNAKEGCGLTPLSLAVLKQNKEIVKLLVDAGAKWNGPLFGSIPSPMDMARILKCTEIEDIFKDDANESEDEDNFIQSLDGSYLSTENGVAQQTVQRNGDSEGNVTIVVGDVGTYKTNAAVMNRSANFQ